MIKAIFPAGVKSLTVHGLYQWDYGQQLEITASDLPSGVVEIHFAHVGMTDAVVRVCSVVNGVVTTTIPDTCLEQTAPVTAWVYIIDDTTGRTVKEVNLPIIARAKPQASESVPEEVSDKYTEALTAMNATLAELASGSITAGLAAKAYNNAEGESLFWDFYYIGRRNSSHGRMQRIDDLNALYEADEVGCYAIDSQDVHQGVVAGLPSEVLDGFQLDDHLHLDILAVADTEQAYQKLTYFHQSGVTIYLRWAVYEADGSDGWTPWSKVTTTL